MSEPGRKVILHLDEAEVRLAKAYWKRYDNSLTPTEKERLKVGDYSSLRRPYKPAFGRGDWLEVSRHLRIQVDDVVPRRGGYRISIASVEDFRASGTPIKTYGEDTESMKNTLSVGGRPNPPEPHGVDPATLRLYSAEAGAKRALGDSERTQERLAEIKQLPVSRRIVELQKLASERGVDVRDDVRAFERRIARRLDKAA